MLDYLLYFLIHVFLIFALGLTRFPTLFSAWWWFGIITLTFNVLMVLVYFALILHAIFTGG